MLLFSIALVGRTTSSAAGDWTMSHAYPAHYISAKLGPSEKVVKVHFLTLKLTFFSHFKSSSDIDADCVQNECCLVISHAIDHLQ